MNWKLKALLMVFFDTIPAGEKMYRILQKRFGNLNDDPAGRIMVQEKMASWLVDQEFSIAGSVFLEVGTGHKPVVPVCFALMGAKAVYTVDLHRRLDDALMRGMLNKFAAAKDQLIKSWTRYTSEDILQERFGLLLRYKDRPEQFFNHIGIQYLAPADAGSLNMPDASIDCHLSNTVLEHIGAKDIRSIMQEASRLLRKGGMAMHFIDLSDHFQHQDPGITPLNFLRYSERAWHLLAGNQFAYANRLRPPDYFDIFDSLGFEIARRETKTYDADPGFDLPDDSPFRSYADHDFRTTELNVLLIRRG
ncbi:MAG: class I SAM-dependent methyltransferase [Desulforudis sp.]|jgi:SAM-dependent methyltransferase|nr:MAG: class I SAM-dependent methyltransferase [Desulforudis sp.]